MPRVLRIGLLLLALAVLAGLFELPVLRMQMARQERQEQYEEVARREVIRSVAESREGKREKVNIYWLSATDPGQLVAVETPVALGSDPVERARAALETLIAGAPTPEQRPLPLDTTLLEFYLMDDGTAVADFSDALSHQLPSGISSEQLALDAITCTLHAAVPQVRKLRILIDGQETETLAGHVDLSGAFDLALMPPSTPAVPPGPPPQEKKSPAASRPRAGE